MSKKVSVDISMSVDCVHFPKDSKKGVVLVPMVLFVSDPELPSWIAKCPQCGCEVVIAFND